MKTPCRFLRWPVISNAIVLCAIAGFSFSCSNSESTKDGSSTQSGGSTPSATSSNSNAATNSGPSGADTLQTQTTPEDDWVGGGPHGGRYKDGVYFCCDKGEDTQTCCAGKAQGMCFHYGGVYKDCVGQDGVMNRKSICSFCCPGLTRIETTIPGTQVPDDQLPEGCDKNPVYPTGNFFCSACGNGVCDEKENSCNCPADCPK